MKDNSIETAWLSGRGGLLLHVCCAPCSSAIVDWLTGQNIRPTLFFYNPNIFPREEYEKRKAESKRHAALLELEWTDADYSRDRWTEAVRGLESEPERGLRCLQCFRERLVATAQHASRHSFRAFATTLASSRWKSLEQIALAGEYAASQYPEVLFWNRDWRRGGLTERRNELMRQYGFYNQTYCGCEYSQRKDPPAK